MHIEVNGATATGWIWYVNNTSIATINQNGVLTGKKRGSVIVTATNGQYKTSFVVTVKDPSIKVARLLLFLVSTGFIMYGVQRGEAAIVLKKAIKICLECIGIG